MGFSGGSDVKESTCDERPGIHPWVGKIPWGRAQQPTAVFLPGESHGQRSLAGLQSIALQRVRHDWSDLACMHSKFSIILIFMGPHKAMGHLLFGKYWYLELKNRKTKWAFSKALQVRKTKGPTNYLSAGWEATSHSLVYLHSPDTLWCDRGRRSLLQIR